MRRLAVAAAVMLAAASAAPASAQQVGRFSEVVLVPADGTSFVVGDRTYEGWLRVQAKSDGLALVELVGLDGYLAGVREVPATWPEAALDAQAVAARTYLAWTLARGRSSTASRYGFDICATTQCQVYAGTAAGEQRWVDAVARTAGEILFYDGAPAQAMYFSTSGGATEPIQDIFAGATPRPYLAGVPSPGESSPLVEWTVSVPVRAFVAILEAGGWSVDDVLSVDVATRPQGDGVWHLEVTGSRGLVRIPVADIRRTFNRHGPDLYPALLPARRPDDRRYPQAILSYRFDATYVPSASLDSALGSLPVDDRPLGGSVVFTGRGWGHHVGMSQYGALAMAEAGSDYAEILGHYYGGLGPRQAGDALPRTVAVGLDWGLASITVRADGPFQVEGDGRAVTVTRGGTWFLLEREGEVAVVSGDLLLDRLLSRFSGAVPVL